MQRLLKSPARSYFLDMTEKQEYVSKVTDPEATVDLLESSKQSIEVLSQAMDSDRYIFDANFRDFEELSKAGAVTKLVVFVDLLLCNPAYNVRRQSDLKNTSHDFFRPNECMTSATYQRR